MGGRRRPSQEITRKKSEKHSRQVELLQQPEERDTLGSRAKVLLFISPLPLDACASPLLFVHHKAQGIKKRKRSVGPRCCCPRWEGGRRLPPWTPLCSRLSQAAAVHVGPVRRDRGEASPPLRCLTAAWAPSGAAWPLGSHFPVQIQRSQRFPEAHIAEEVNGIRHSCLLKSAYDEADDDYANSHSQAYLLHLVLSLD
ncbi:hypothetical protein MUK42_27455 [Musa troglodytarum]|uniref:Uncharacterized protein n=1 Tax=Musa troglodytarum TaxID=320322 RepID=A0A9E7F7Z3_9LILI|nr:hypothetical protein MUK42_27455 [Musa troglodytarum]